jgi:hypothetical protein
VGGLQKVSDLRLRRPIAEHFIQAATEIGIPFNEDYTGAEQARRDIEFSRARVKSFAKAQLASMQEFDTGVSPGLVCS